MRFLILLLPVARITMGTICFEPRPCDMLKPGIAYFVGKAIESKPTGRYLYSGSAVGRQELKATLYYVSRAYLGTRKGHMVTVESTWAPEPGAEAFVAGGWHAGVVRGFDYCGGPGGMQEFLEKRERGRTEKTSITVYMPPTNEPATIKVRGPVEFTRRVAPSRVSTPIRFDGVPPGLYSAEASAVGYVMRRPGLDEILEGGCGGLAVQMEGTRRITGTYREDDGAPVPNAYLLFEPAEGESEYVQPRFVRTGEDGRFLLARIPPGEYRLRSTTHRVSLDEYGRDALVRVPAANDVSLELVRFRPVRKLFQLQFLVEGRRPLVNTAVRISDSTVYHDGRLHEEVQELKTDENGYVHLLLVEGVRYDRTATGDGKKFGPFQMEIREGQPASLSVREGAAW